MKTSPRYRRGDTSPLRPGLVFNSYNGRFEKWVTPENLEKERARLRTPEYRLWANENRTRPEVKERRKLEYENAKARIPVIEKKFHRGDVNPDNSELVFWCYHMGVERWMPSK